MEIPKLKNPWLIAVWPGMGSVAASAGYYLMAKLGMQLLADFDGDDMFDVDHVEIRDGLIQQGRRPRNRFFLWRDPRQVHDIVMFVGEAQPPIGKYRFCSKLLDFARQLGVTRVLTFAAMATHMHPEHKSRVFAAACDQATLEELKNSDLQVLDTGEIGGLNGVLLGAVAERSLRGACLLGEMPHILAQFPFPKASLAVLQAFVRLGGIELDFSELIDETRAMDRRLGELLAQVERSIGQESALEEEAYTTESPAEEQGLTPAEQHSVDELFEQAAKDRSRAFELKQELDRLGVFKDYENRFLDLFRPGKQEP